MFNFKKKIILITIFFILNTMLFISLYKYYSNKNMQETLKIESYYYYNSIKSIEKNDIKSAKLNSKYTIQKNTHSIYFNLSCLLLAKMYFDTGKYVKSKNYLQLIINNKKSKFLNLANIKIIEILIFEKQYVNALSKINLITNKNPYICVYENLKGDIYTKIKKKNLARIAYLKTLSKAKNNKYKHIIKLKLEILKNTN